MFFSELFSGFSGCILIEYCQKIYFRNKWYLFSFFEKSRAFYPNENCAFKLFFENIEFITCFHLKVQENDKFNGIKLKLQF